MQSLTSGQRKALLTRCAAVLLFGSAIRPLCGAEVSGTGTNAIPPNAGHGSVVTNMSQVLQHSLQELVTSLPIRVEGTILESDPRNGFMELSDDTDIARIQFDPRHASVRPGQRVRIEGTGLFGQGRASLAALPLINNDGRHPVRELSAAAHLTAGYHPIQVRYFQYTGLRLLNVRYEGPGITKNRIPAEALFHSVPGENGELEYVPRLNFQLYHGTWQALPMLGGREPNRAGTVPNFSLGASGSRSNGFALNFSGYLKIEREGDYTFFLESDDGSQLFIGEQNPPRVEVLGIGELPLMTKARPGQPVSPTEEDVMVETEGVVTFFHQEGSFLVVELSDDYASIRLRLPNTDPDEILPLLGCRVKAQGRVVRTLDLNGESVLGGLTTTGLNALQIVQVPESVWANIPAINLDEAAAGRTGAVRNALVQFRGRVLRQVPGATLVIGSEPGTVEVRSSQRLLVPAGTEVRAVGRWQRMGDRGILENAFFQVLDVSGIQAGEELPLLTTAQQVHSLTPEEAAREYPVRLRGVITSEFPVRIQDETRGAFVERTPFLNPSNAVLGGLYEIEGLTSPGRFAPAVRPIRATLLGTSLMPRPIRPTYEQFMSLAEATQWAEMEGVVQSVTRPTRQWEIQLATKSGPILVRMPAFEVSSLSWTNRLEDAEVRIRGTIAAQFNDQRQIQGAFLNVPSPAHICVVKRGPANPFALPRQPVAGLRRFNPEGALHRVKVEGQLTHVRDDACFLMDGTNGMIFHPRQKLDLQVGDVIAVAGYQDLLRRTPALRDALVQRRGHEPLAVPPLRTVEQLMSGEWNSARVRVQAYLVSVRTNAGERVLELQSGLRSFNARQKLSGDGGPGIDQGSLVELTGVCDGRASMPRQVPGEPYTTMPLESFDLLLNSPLDIRRLHGPPPWTLKEALSVIAALGLAVVLAMLWIYLLRRRVEERTAQLQTANKELEAFSYSVSHDLRAPLRSIDGFSKALLEDYGDRLDDGAADALKRVRRASQRMEGLIDDMLTLSKISRAELRFNSIDLTNLARTLAAELQGAEPERKAEFVILPGMTVRGDSSLIRIALENLLGNAWKYTGKNPGAKIEVGLCQINGEKVHFVRDNGVGFDMEFAGKLFGAFQRLHPESEFPGTGVGLATVHRVVQRHGGRIWAQGKVNQGATFYFTIPD